MAKSLHFGTQLSCNFDPFSRSVLQVPPPSRWSGYDVLAGLLLT